MVSCPLCKAVKNESAIYEDKWIKIVETKRLKGHRRRIMVITKKHIDVVPSWLDKHMLDKLEETGRKIFNYTYKFVIMSPIYGTIPNHAHYVATDLEEGSEDHKQILATPWLRVVQVKGWKNG